MPEVEILTTDSEIVDLALTLSKQTSVAVDFEMDALHNYREKVCLMQVSIPDRDLIIDPLAGADLKPLAPVFAAQKIRKIFHAADYDLRSLRRDYRFEVTGLLDTMVAAQLCGEEKIGLADLLQKYFGVELDKKYQKADWSKRPLSPEMIRYAAADTCYLHRLAELMEARLRELGRHEWLEEECRWLEAVEFEQNSGPLFLRFKGAGRLEPQQLAVLEELLQWRDQEAERRNCPLFKVIGNKPILQIAQNRPLSRKQLSEFPEFPPRLVDRYGKVLLACVERALAQQESEWPRYPRSERPKRDPQVDSVVAKMKKWRSGRAEGLSIEPGVLINNALLEAIARNRPKSVEKLSDVAGLRRWQIAEMGAELVDLVD
ncbi:MAG: ribonuclease D [Desulfuromonas sp.]|nr:MAG: ribonuclease D [Desulfuromonas sp.]